jgi:hypothetical protein
MKIMQINIFDAQPQTLQQTQSTSVKELCHQPILPIQLRKHRAHFFRRQYNRHFGWSLYPQSVTHEAELTLQYFLVQK